MAVNLDTFESTSVGLDQENFGKIPDSQFDAAMAEKMQEDITKSLTPEDVKPSDANKVDVQLQGNIAVNLKKKKLFTGDLTNIEDEDSKTAVDKVDALFKRSSPFTTNVTESTNIHRGIGPAATLKPVGVSGKTVEEELAEEELGDPGQPMGELDFEKILDPAKEYAVKGYRSVLDYFKEQEYAGTPSIGSVGYGAGTSGSYGGSSGTLTGGSAGSTQGYTGTGYGSLQNTSVQRTQQAVSGLGIQAPQWANQATLGQVSGGGYGGLASSSATAAGQLATSGAGVNALGQPMYGSTAASGAGRSLFGTVAAGVGIYTGIKNKDYFSAGASLITLINPATAVPMAVIMGAKALFGAWSASKRPKPKFGGAEFAATVNSLTATGGWGYNGYKPEAGKATVASVADYVNSYTKHFGLNFNGRKWAKAVAADPKLNRYDSTNESGYGDPGVLSRKIFETQGLITGNPTVNGVPITSQEDYKEKMVQFNDWYKKTALDRGGLVDAQRVGIDPASLSNEYKQITYKDSSKLQAPSGGSQYQTRTTGGNRSGGGTQQTGYYQQGPGRSGQSTWVPAPSNVVLDPGTGYSGSGGGAYAVNYRYEDAAPHEMLYRNLVGKFQTGQGGTYY